MEINTEIRFAPNLEPRPGWFIPWFSENQNGFPVKVESESTVLANNHINPRGKWLVSTLFKVLPGLKSVCLDEETKSVILAIHGYVSASDYNAINEVEKVLCSVDDNELTEFDYKSLIEEMSYSSPVNRRRAVRDRNIRLAKAE